MNAMTLDGRRVDLLCGITDQTDAVINLLLNTNVINDFEDGPMLLSLLLRLREINVVAMRVRDRNDRDIDDMESIVFGKVMGHGGPEARVAEPA